MIDDTSKVKDIFKGLSFSDEELKTAAKLLKKIDYKKGDLVFKANDLVDDIYFIYSGCLRTFYINNIGKEHTFQFGVKDCWITDFSAFYTASKAIMNLEVIENATLYKLSNTDKELLYSQVPQIQTYIRKRLELAHAAFQKRIIVSLSQTAKVRYLIFLNTHRNIENKLKNYHIASYLGITTESLSRIRKELYNS